MPPVRKRKSLEDVSHDFQQFLYYRAQAATQGKEKDKFGKKLRDFCKTHGIVRKDDEGNEISGNIEYHLSEPVFVGDKVFKGFELRKTSQPEFDEDAALELAKEKDLLGEVGTRIIRLKEADFLAITSLLAKVTRADWDDFGAKLSFEIDQNAFYRLYQQEKLTEAEIDSLLTEPDELKYSFWPLEGSDTDDE
jgi:hypothetical protein